MGKGKQSLPEVLLLIYDFRQGNYNNRKMRVICQKKIFDKKEYVFIYLFIYNRSYKR
jgi:hypothetical protein